MCGNSHGMPCLHPIFHLKVKPNTQFYLRSKSLTYVHQCSCHVACSFVQITITKYIDHYDPFSFSSAESRVWPTGVCLCVVEPSMEAARYVWLVRNRASAATQPHHTRRPSRRWPKPRKAIKISTAALAVAAMCVLNRIMVRLEWWWSRWRMASERICH